MLRVLLVRLLEFLAVLWLIRLFWRALAGWISGSAGSSQFGPAKASRPSSPFPREARDAPRELKKDPQCGTYVAPELSIRSLYRGEELYFCSRECEQKFLQARSEKSA